MNKSTTVIHVQNESEFNRLMAFYEGKHWRTVPVSDYKYNKQFPYIELKDFWVRFNGQDIDPSDEVISFQEFLTRE